MVISVVCCQPCFLSENRFEISIRNRRSNAQILKGTNAGRHVSCVALYGIVQLTCGVGMWTVSLSVWYEEQGLNWIETVLFKLSNQV